MQIKLSNQAFQLRAIRAREFVTLVLEAKENPPVAAARKFEAAKSQRHFTSAGRNGRNNVAGRKREDSFDRFLRGRKRAFDFAPGRQAAFDVAGVAGRDAPRMPGIFGIFEDFNSRGRREPVQSFHRQPRHAFRQEKAAGPAPLASVRVRANGRARSIRN